MQFRRAMGLIDDAVWIRQPADRIAELRAMFDLEQSVKPRE